MATLGEKLRGEFYQWESIGRGEKSWSTPVRPEPYFVPFFGHGAFLDDESPADTGVRASLLDRARSLFGRSSNALRDPESFGHLLNFLEEDSPPPAILDRRENLDSVEFRVLLPEGEKVDHKRVEQFLYSLSGTTFPITFEIIALSEAIVLQFSVDPNDATLFAEMFEAFFPLVSFNVATENCLFGIIREVSDYAVISRELALEKEFFYPCKGFREFEVDPYQTLFGSLGTLSAGEIVIVQITFAPALHTWGKSVNALVENGEGGPFFVGRPEDLHAAKVKNSKPYFGVTVRLSSLTPSKHRCREILRPIAASFEHYEGQNGFVLADQNGEEDDHQQMIEIAHRLSRRSGMLLNGNELLGLVHFPGPDVHAPKLVRPLEAVREAPENLIKDEGLFLGITDEESGAISATLSTEERLRHMHVLGGSGTGKSTFFANSIIQDLRAGHGIALLDPHGDLVEHVLNHIPEERLGDVILFDPADSEFPVGFNMLAARTEAEKNLLASDFVSIIQRLSSSWGDNMTSILGNAVMAFLESPRGGTLLDLRRFLSDEAFRNEYLESVTEPEVRYFWTNEFPLVRGSAQASLVTRLGSFIRQKLLRNMVAQRGEKLDFAKMMNEGKIFLAPLAQGLIGEECSFLLGSTLVSKFYQTALTRQEMAEAQRKPFFLYIDEAHNFVTPSIASILSGTRKYGLGLILAHQDLDQFSSRSSSVLSSLITNAHTRICFKLGDHDARKLEEGFEHYDAQRLRQLGRGEAISRVGGSQNDFLLRTQPPLPVPDHASQIRDQVINYSRETYGTERSFVEKELEAYYTGPPPRKRVAKKTSSIKEPIPKIEKLKPQKGVEEKTAPPPKKEERQSEKALEKVPPKGPEIPMLSPESVEKAKPYQTPKKEKSQGRGGAVHKALQAQIKQQAISIGLGAEIESELPNGGGKVDVLLSGQTVSVAIEIALKSPVDQEVRNIEKCLRQGFDEIIVVSDDSQHLQEIRDSAMEAGLGERLESVRFLGVSALGEFLSEFGASLASSETENLGYNVTTNYVTKSDDDLKARNDRIHKMVADLKKKLEQEAQEKGGEDEEE